MKHRMIRILIAVVLICALLVSWSPIRAQASALPEVAEVVTKVIPFAKVVEPAALGVGGTVFCWVALGLGVAFKAKQAVDAYNAYQDFTGDLEMSIYYYPDGSWSYGVDMGFVERVRTFLFDEGYLIAPGEYVVTVPEGVSYRNYTPRVPCVAYNYCYAYSSADKSKWWFETSGYLVSLIPNDPYVISGRKSTTYITVNENKHYALCTISGTKTTTENKLGELAANEPTLYYFGKQRMFLQDVWNYFGWTGVCGSTDVDIGYVGSPSVPMPDAYPEWHTNARPATNPGTQEEITVLPIPLDPSVDPETQIGTLTQPNIWQGSIADPMPDTDPDTGTDVPPADIADYSIDLTSFFPFCLPFDIYAFFELLAADPETPHLEFDIELPFMQEPWHVVIDLSAWDSTALLARRLELLAFIIGLCVFTREKFLRS